MQEIKVVDTITHIRKHPEMYFGNQEPSASALMTHLIDDAVTLNALPIHCDFLEGWWIVAAENDWVLKLNRFSLIDTFHRFGPSPEMGRNEYRSNVLVTAFAKNVIVFGKEGKTIIKDCNLDLMELERHIFEKYRGYRVIAFRGLDLPARVRNAHGLSDRPAR